MRPTSQLPPPGWYPDPAGSGAERYWDGGTWSHVTRPSATPQAPPPQPMSMPAQAPAARLAGWWWRVLAYIIDWVILMYPVAFVQNLILGETSPAVAAWVNDVFLSVQQGGTVMPAIPAAVWSAVFLNALVSVILWIIYGTIFVTKLGGTLGQSAVGMRVIADGDQSLSKIGWGRSTIRAVVANILPYIPLLGLLNVLMPLFTRKKQTFHDMIAQTVMVKK